jgi:hypothetical protein
MLEDTDRNPENSSLASPSMLLMIPYLALRPSAILLIFNETHRSLLVHSSKPYQLYQAKKGYLCEELLYFVANCMAKELDFFHST